ncbi:MAG: LysM peptidoglycan-binding domain-containing protein [Chloroflexi bacterium]|nr:LysM peptidoglycan-binding domain-containing protein [Chloroflexota bacterium]
MSKDFQSSLGCLGLVAIAVALFWIFGIDMGGREARIVELQPTPATSPATSETGATVAMAMPVAIERASPTVSPGAETAPGRRTATPVSTPTPSPSPTAAPTPAPTTYAVQAGDTLSAIADRFGVELDGLVALNRIDDPNVISVGTVLRIPGSGSGALAASQTGATDPAPTQRPAQTQGSPYPCPGLAHSETGTTGGQSMEAHGRELSLMDSAFDELDGLADRLIDDPDLWLDADWQAQFTAQLDVIERSGEGIRNLDWNPSWPSSLHDVRNPATRIWDDIWTAKAWLEDFGKNRQNLLAFEQGWKSLERGSRNVDLALQALDRIC